MTSPFQTSGADSDIRLKNMERERPQTTTPVRNANTEIVETQTQKLFFCKQLGVILCRLFCIWMSFPLLFLGISDFQCSICMKMFPTRIVLLTHKKTVHEEIEDRFSCDQPGCAVTASTALRLKLHRESAHGCKFSLFSACVHWGRVATITVRWIGFQPLRAGVGGVFIEALTVRWT